MDATQSLARSSSRLAIATAWGDYVLEQKLDEHTTFLRWRRTIEGHKFESLELVVDRPDGKLVERTIAYRPFPALKIFREKTRAAHGDTLPPDMWDCAT